MIKGCNIKEVEICKEDENIVDVAKQLRDKQYRHVFVVDNNGAPIGVISTVDINNKVVAEGKNPSGLKAKDVMNTPVEYVDINKETEFALKIMMEKNTFSCPVVEDGKLKGVVSYGEVFSKVSNKVQGGE